jgi:hypothetical protein
VKSQSKAVLLVSANYHSITSPPGTLMTWEFHNLMGRHRAATRRGGEVIWMEMVREYML